MRFLVSASMGGSTVPKSSPSTFLKSVWGQRPVSYMPSLPPMKSWSAPPCWALTAAGVGATFSVRLMAACQSSTWVVASLSAKPLALAPSGLMKSPSCCQT